MKVREVVAALERFAPLPLQEDYDNAGLQIGLPEANEVSGALFCLDVTDDVLRQAVEVGCNLVVAHHPLFFRPLRRLTDASLPERLARRAIEAGIAIYAAHTNLDNARGGVSWEMARLLGLQSVDFLQPLPSGQGGSGAWGTLPQPMPLQSFLLQVREAFGIPTLSYVPGPMRPVQRVALCGGAGASLLHAAAALPADVFITGEMGYHHCFGYEGQLTLVLLGHYQSELCAVHLMRRIVQQACPQLPTYACATSTDPMRHL